MEFYTVDGDFSKRVLFFEMSLVVVSACIRNIKAHQRFLRFDKAHLKHVTTCVRDTLLARLGTCALQSRISLKVLNQSIYYLYGKVGLSIIAVFRLIRIFFLRWIMYFLVLHYGSQPTKSLT